MRLELFGEKSKTHFIKFIHGKFCQDQTMACGSAGGSKPGILTDWARRTQLLFKK